VQLCAACSSRTRGILPHIDATSSPEDRTQRARRSASTAWCSSGLGNKLDGLCGA
jgi:hypothetical protein